MVATIAVASAKGGCGKTTTAILMAAEFALDGYTVKLLDCDLNQHASAFGVKANILASQKSELDKLAFIPNLRIVPNVVELNILSELRQAEAENDLVIIDLPGGSSTLALKALQRSHFVLVPTQNSLLDVRDATKTIAQIDDAEELARMPISRAIVWTRFSPGFESRAGRFVRVELEKEGIPIFQNVLMERTAFREMHITGRVPRQVNPQGGPTVNVSTIANELLDHIKKLSEKAA